MAMPTFPKATQWSVAALLAVAMIVTRGTHFATIDALPSASWAVFFLAGVFLRPLWWFAAFFALASLIDFSLLEAGRISQWCVSPAYWALIPAYGALWFAGRLYSSLHRDSLATLLPLAICVVGSASIAYLCSGGGFYFFSGRYPDPDLAGFLPRIGQYLPPHLGNLLMYLGLASMLYLGVRTLDRDPAMAST